MTQQAKKRPVGRPSEYEERFCDELEEFMARGYSFTAFAGSIGVCRATLDNWAEAHPEFLGARNRAKAKRLMHWETAGLKVAEKGGGPGTAQMIAFGLKNMGDGEWVDLTKREVTGKDGEPLVVNINGVAADL